MRCSSRNTIDSAASDHLTYTARVLSEQDQKRAEKESRERFEQAVVELREGNYRFSSKVRGQADIILEELIDPDGEAVSMIADVEGDTGAMALAIPLDMITFETWLFGQIGDREQLDLETPNHRELWFNFGAWIGESLRRRHGGHWLVFDDDPSGWRLGFSKIMLEIVPHTFGRQLLEMGQGAVRKLITEIERLRQLHAEQRERDRGKEIDRFTAQHYIRMHSIPLGQWLVLDFKTIARMWNQAAVRDLIKELKKQGKRLGPGNAPLIQNLVESLSKADQSKPVGAQASDRGMFEAIAQIIGLRRTAAPIAMDVLEKYVMPTMHIGIPDKFPPLDDDDLLNLRRGMEMFAVFADVVPHKHKADDEGFLRAIPQEDLSSPYGDKSSLEVGKGDWVIVNPKRFKSMLLEFDSKRLLKSYEDFVKYVAGNPKAPRRHDDGRMLAETVAKALVDFKASVVAASKDDDHALVFRMLPPPP